jgi:hypothetical protein
MSDAESSVVKGRISESSATSDPADGKGARDGLTTYRIFDGLDRLLARRLVGLVFLVLAAVLPLLRQRGTPSWRTVWAEDGGLYTQQAVNVGGLRVLLRGYMGYLQLPPRLIALPTPYFSLRYLALYSSLVSVVVGALLAWGVYHWSRGWIQPRPVRFALAALVVLMPALGGDSTATFTNLIWLFLAALPWALISKEEGNLDLVGRSAVAALAATSSLLSLCFLPLALGWLVYRRSKAAVVVTTSFAVGAVLQGAVALRSKTGTNFLVAHRSVHDVVSIAEGEAGHVFGTFLLGTRGEFDLGSVSGALAVALPTIIVLGALGVLAWGADRAVKVLAGGCVATGIVLFAGTVWERGPGVYGLAQSTLALNGRYSVPPVMLIASAFALLVSCRGAQRHRRSRRAGAPLFVLQTVLVIALCFSVTNERSSDPPWIGRVDHTFAQHCVGRPGSVLAIVPNQTGTGFFGGPNGLFPLTVPCSHLS